MHFDKWRSILWPAGGSLLGVLVVPIAIEQYPETFKNNAWILPLLMCLVLGCWIAPLLIHSNVVRLYKALEVKTGGPRAVAIFALGTALAIFLTVYGGDQLFHFHQRHIAKKLQYIDRLSSEGSNKRSANAPTISNSNPAPIQNKQSPSQPKRSVGIECPNSLSFTQSVKLDDGPDPYYIDQITITPKHFKQEVSNFIRFHATGIITGGAGEGVPEKGGHSFDYPPSGIAGASGRLGVIIHNNKWAELWLSDQRRFEDAGAVSLRLTGLERFKVDCVQQPPIPENELIKIGPAKPPQ